MGFSFAPSRGKFLAGILGALAAVLVLFAGSDSASATTYSPSFGVRLSEMGTGNNADVTLSFAIPSGDSNFASSITFIPPEWGVASDAAVANGAVGGSLVAVSTLGFFSTACAVPFLTAPPLLESIADTSNGVVTFEAGPIGTWFDPVDGLDDNGGLEIRKANVQYPASLLGFPFPHTSVGGPFGFPQTRYFGYVNVSGTNVGINILIYAPGALALAGFPASLGYATVTLINRLGDSTAIPTPSPITDFCAPILSTTTYKGVSLDNATTAADESGAILMTNAPGSGTRLWTSLTVSQRDADSDGYENGLDTCPFDVNVDTSPRLGLLTSDPDRGFGLIPEGIDGACDLDPTTGCGPGLGDDFFSLDCDFDGFGNRGDNCPQTFNNQADMDGDSIGDLCDGVVSLDNPTGAGSSCLPPAPGAPNPCADGHNHTVSIALHARPPTAGPK